MAKLYYGKRTAITHSATDAQSGYPASNASLESVRRNWRAVDAGAKVWTVDFGSAGNVAALLLQDVNFSTCEVLKSPDASAFSSVGTLTTYADKLTGRRRGLIVVNDANVRAVRISIGAGTPTDGLGYWRIGAVYPFASSSTLTGAFLVGAKVDAMFPMVSADLPNEHVAQASTGDDILALTLPARREYNEDILEVVRRARAGTVALDMALSDYPELALPVRFIGRRQGEDFSSYRVTSATIELREVA